MAYMNHGAFYGGPGDDTTTWTWGTFEGGPGNDQVLYHLMGTFNGGPGNDRVRNLPGFYGEFNPGTFNGGPGDDVVEWMGLPAGTFSGGPGTDIVIDYEGGFCYSVVDCPR